MQDLTEPRSEAAGVTWERSCRRAPTFYGLGPRLEATFGLRGKSMRAESPFLVSTAGYGEFHTGAGTYQFDFTAAGRYRIQGPEIDYYFYFGPTPKEIFEEHKTVHEPARAVDGGERALRLVGGPAGVAAADCAGRDVGGERAGVRPGSYANAPEELKPRARQLGSLVAR